MSVPDTDDTWQQALRMDPESAEQQARRQLIKAFKDEMRRAGSCQNYLNKMLATHEKQDEFRAALVRMVPRSSGHTYLTTTPFPVWEQSQPLNNVFILHVSDFDFHPTASIQMAAGPEKTDILMDRYEMEGFLTDSEYITISSRGVVAGPVLPFSVKFVKGQGRMNLLQAFMLYCHVHEEALPAKLAATCTLVYCKAPLIRDAQQEMYWAMQQGYRSSVRKAPHVIQWVWSLTKVQMIQGVLPLQ